VGLVDFLGDWGRLSKIETNSAGPPFSALLALADVQGTSATELVSAIRRLYPTARVTGWGGSGLPVRSARGIMLSVNGRDMAIVHQKLRAQLEIFDGGNQPDPW
jgi:hypothetical protein